VVAVTNASGVATFNIVGEAINPGGGTPGAPAAGFGFAGASVSADGTPLGTLNVSAFNQNLSGAGITGTDVARVKNDVLSITGPANYRGRSDLNPDGVVNGADLAKILNASFIVPPGTDGSPYCP
jgi:hypothetical protein